MVYNVPFIFTRNLNYRMMARAGSDSRILLKNLANTLEGPHRRISYSVGHAVIRTCPSAFRPHKIVFAISYEHEWPLDVFVRRNFFKGTSVSKWKEPVK